MIDIQSILWKDALESDIRSGNHWSHVIAMCKRLSSDAVATNGVAKRDELLVHFDLNTELRSWIEEHPNNQYADEARQRYNDCVKALREIDEPFYDWLAEEIENLEKL